MYIHRYKRSSAGIVACVCVYILLQRVKRENPGMCVFLYIVINGQARELRGVQIDVSLASGEIGGGGGEGAADGGGGGILVDPSPAVPCTHSKHR